MVGRENDFEGEYWLWLEKIIIKKIVLNLEEKRKLVKRLKTQGSCSHSREMYKDYAHEIENINQAPTAEKKPR